MARREGGTSEWEGRLGGLRGRTSSPLPLPSLLPRELCSPGKVGLTGPQAGNLMEQCSSFLVIRGMQITTVCGWYQDANFYL